MQQIEFFPVPPEWVPVDYQPEEFQLWNHPVKDVLLQVPYQEFR